MLCVSDCDFLKKINHSNYFCSLYEKTLINSHNDKVYTCDQCKDKEIETFREKFKEYKLLVEDINENNFKYINNLLERL